MLIEYRAYCRHERFVTGASITLNTVGRQAVLPKLVRIAKWTFRWHERIDQLRLSTVAGTVTEYSTDIDFQIKTAVAAIVFGYKDDTQFLMWQIGAREAEGKVYFTPHVYDTKYAIVEEKDISEFVKWEDAYKIHHLKVTVDSKNEVKTYVDNALIHTYTDPIATYGKFGFRQYSTIEEAYFDNIVITNTSDKKVIKQIDFNNNTNPFPEGVISNIMGGSPSLELSNGTGIGETTILP